MNCELKKTELNFLARRSIRSYTPKEIEEDKLNKILKAALVSPTGKNLKPFELVVIKDKEMLVKLSESKDSGSNMLKEANMAIVVLGNPEISDLWSDDSSIVSFAIQLKAFDLGIGSCWVNLKGRESKYGISSEEYVKNILNIPKKMRISCIISLGYPNEVKDEYKEDEIDLSKVHYEKY